MAWLWPVTSPGPATVLLARSATLTESTPQATLAAADCYNGVMPRIDLVDPDDPATDPETSNLLLRLREQLGGDNNFFLAAANNRAALEGLMAFGKAAYFGPLVDPATTELAYLAASQVNDCHY